jgi:hypothetical protein
MALGAPIRPVAETSSIRIEAPRPPERRIDVPQDDCVAASTKTPRCRGLQAIEFCEELTDDTAAAAHDSINKLRLRPSASTSSKKSRHGALPPRRFSKCALEILFASARATCRARLRFQWR